MPKAIKALKLYQGWIQHTRTEPSKHQFRYNYFQTWLDVENPQLIDQVSSLWSTKRFNLVRYQRQNYQPSDQSIHSTISSIIKHKTGRDFYGKIYLLGNLTHWGYCYNPVSFYFCYNQEQQLQYILSEIHNTPWGERFTYLHDISERVREDSSRASNPQNDTLKFNFDKNFHVSPFMPMELEYQWNFKITDKKILISMNLNQHSKSVFNATMNLTEQTLTSKKAMKIALCYPVTCLKVLIAIYWQALRLWLKRIPFHSHPTKIS